MMAIYKGGLVTGAIFILLRNGLVAAKITRPA